MKIMLDFWGTLVNAGTKAPLKQLKYVLRSDSTIPEFVVKIEKVLMTKKYDSMRDAFTAVCKDFNCPPKSFILDKLIGIWNKSWILAALYPDTIKELKNLSKNHELYLLSNTDCISVDQVLEKFELRQYFKKVLLSCETGKLKAEMMKDLVKNKDEWMMVGDSTKSDIEPAQALGIKAIMMDRNDKRQNFEGVRVTDLEQLQEVL